MLLQAASKNANERAAPDHDPRTTSSGYPGGRAGEGAFSVANKAFNKFIATGKCDKRQNCRFIHEIENDKKNKGKGNGNVQET